MSRTGWAGRLPLVAIWLALVAATAQAHSVSTAYVRLDADLTHSELRVDLPLRDLEDVVGLDADGDGRITWREVESAAPRVSTLVNSGVRVRRGAVDCRVTPKPIAIDVHAGTAHAVLSSTLDCPGHGAWSIEYDLLFDRDRTHRALLAIETGGKSASVAVLDTEHRTWHDAEGGWFRFFEFVRQGIWHIWLGYDHLAFLLLLLLPSVLERRPGGWTPSMDRRRIFMRILKVVTAFTAAHSITLSLATLGILTPPAAPIEAGIAITVILAGIANLFPRFAVHGARMAFAFGLIHGFGFANALAELGLARGGVAAPLAGFNVGVELGQLAVVALLLPLLDRLRTVPLYAARVLPATSLTIAVLGLGWLVQRLGTG
jgi:hypothetical protein